MFDKMNQALAFLRDKYGCPAGEIVPGAELSELELPGGKRVPLLPWRVERRFVELRKIVESGTLEEVSTFRFAAFDHGGDPVKSAARELDLAAFLAASPVARVFAVRSGNAACNILARLANGMSASVECGSMLPAGAAALDRHEIIARRGVASDRAVDTQIPQCSIYEWTTDGVATFTDVDTELFGLPNDRIWIVRAAYAALMDPELAPVWTDAARNMARCADAIARSAADNTPVTL